MMVRKYSRVSLVALLMLCVPPETQFAYAQGGRGRRFQENLQRGSHRQGPEPVFHTDVPERLLDVTLARPTDQNVTVVITAHEELEMRVEYGTKPGEYTSFTSLKSCDRGDTTHVLLSSPPADLLLLQSIHCTTCPCLYLIPVFPIFLRTYSFS